MQTDLQQILEQNHLFYHRVIVALTSRDILSIEDFLTKGNAVLKNIEKVRQTSMQSMRYENFGELVVEDTRDAKLITYIEQKKLQKILDTLIQKAQSQKNQQEQHIEKQEPNKELHIESLLRQLQDL